MPDIPELKAEDEYRLIAYVSATNFETLCAYAAFKKGDLDYVLNAVVELKLATDQKFVQWRRTNQQSFLPPNASPVQRSIAAAKRPPRRPRRRIVSTNSRGSVGNGHAATDGEH